MGARQKPDADIAKALTLDRRTAMALAMAAAPLSPHIG